MFYLVHVLASHFAAACDNNQSFLGLWPWYHYLQLQQQGNVCSVNITSSQVLGNHSFLLLILLALIDDLLRIIGLLAVLYVIYAGIRYSMSQGSPDELAKSQNTILNALAGLAISLVAVRVVSFLGNQFSNTTGTQTAQGLDLRSLPNPAGVANGDIVPTLLSVVFSIAGAIAFVYLVIGGFHYVNSQGDPQRIGKAKNTIMYALVGLIVVILAQTIVSVVISKI
jgi:hypothetical protein